MGSFSWCYCDQGEIPYSSDGHPRPKKAQRVRSYTYECPASVLFPKEFGGSNAQINVDMYEDYGVFGTEDIYCLVADWNRKWISEHPDFVRPHSIEYAKNNPKYPARPLKEMSWWPFYSDLSLSRSEVVRRWAEKVNFGKEKCDRVLVEYRQIGIDIACYNDDNAALPYPIKIAKNPDSVYEECPPSIGDPDQGF